MLVHMPVQSLALHSATRPVSLDARLSERLLLGWSRRTWGAVAIVALLAPYTALNVATLDPFLRYAGGLVLAHLALHVAVWADFRRALPLNGTRQVAGGPLRRATFAAVLLLVAALVAGVLLVKGSPSDWLWIFLFAPASAFAQELYFRGTLLPALDELYPQARASAVVIQAVAFATWHARAFLEAEALAATLFVLVTFVAGLVWGHLVRRAGSLGAGVATHTAALVGWDLILVLQGVPIQ
jgi:membrane protease YdiL (CAAX protease family)